MLSVCWLICETGPVEWQGTNTYDTLYTSIPGKYRYALGYSDGEFVCWDIYTSSVDPLSLLVAPHFVDLFVDMDHALAALTINYNQDRDAWARRVEASLRKRVLVS